MDQSKGYNKSSILGRVRIYAPLGAVQGPNFTPPNDPQRQTPRTTPITVTAMKT